MAAARDNNGLPQRPADNAPSAEWRAYAAALEKIHAAGERRANYLHDRLNALVSSPAFRLARSAKNILSAPRRGQLPKEPAGEPTVEGQPLVSVLIPFRDGPKFLARCLETFRTITRYTNVEFILIDNGSAQSATKKLLEKQSKQKNVRILRLDEPFNFSRLNNQAAKEARGEFLLLLNNDIEILHPHWLAALLERAQQPNVGAVGARLVYADGRIQHAGVSVAQDDIAGHPHRLCPADDPAVLTPSQPDAVTAACLLTPRELYLALGGLDESHLPVAYNDVDYCLRVREKGQQIWYEPRACLIHHESVSRGNVNAPSQSAYMVRRWGEVLAKGAK
jgi:O-antigen biosynthesis protein